MSSSETTTSASGTRQSGTVLTLPIVPIATDPPDTESQIRLATLPVLAVIAALWVVWVGLDGAYGENVWYPSALGCLSLWAVVIGLRRRVLPETPIVRVALLAFATLVALNYLSI